MSLLGRLLFVPVLAGFCGIIACFFAGRAPTSGKGALALLGLPVVSVLLLGFEFGGVARELVASGIFGFSVPVCLAYAFHARRRAAERRLALAALAGSILFGVAWIIMMPQLVFLFLQQALRPDGSH